MEQKRVTLFVDFEGTLAPTISYWDRILALVEKIFGIYGIKIFSKRYREYLQDPKGEFLRYNLNQNLVSIIRHFCTILAFFLRFCLPEETVGELRENLEIIEKLKQRYNILICTYSPKPWVLSLLKGVGNSNVKILFLSPSTSKEDIVRDYSPEKVIIVDDCLPFLLKLARLGYKNLVWVNPYGKKITFRKNFQVYEIPSFKYIQEFLALVIK